MKKAFTLLFTVIVIFSAACSSRALSNPPTDVSFSEVIVQDDEQNTFTLDLISNSSWEELKDISMYISKEDDYCGWLIEKLSYYEEVEEDYTQFFSDGYGGILYHELDFDRLLKKITSIIDLYNTTHQISISFHPLILNDTYAQIDFYSQNLLDLQNPVTKIGQQAIVKKGAVCYQDLDESLSSIISEDKLVYVTAVSYLDDENSTKEIITETNFPIRFYDKHLLQVACDESTLGWIPSEYVVFTTDLPEPQPFNSEMLLEKFNQIEDFDTFIGVDETCLNKFYDSNFQKMIMQCEFNPETSFMLFHKTEKDGYGNWIYDGLDELLNRMDDGNYKNVILITDLNEFEYEFDCTFQVDYDFPIQFDIYCPNADYNKYILMALQKRYLNSTINVYVVD